MFHSLSGLKINTGKSVFFSAGIERREEEEILDCIGFQAGQLPIKYLGIPLVTRKLKKADCVPLLEMISSKLDLWANNWLTYAGRVVLIKSVLYSIYSFRASVVMIPKGIINEIKKKFRAFLWRGTEIPASVSLLCGQSLRK